MERGCGKRRAYAATILFVLAAIGAHAEVGAQTAGYDPSIATAMTRDHAPWVAALIEGQEADTRKGAADTIPESVSVRAVDMLLVIFIPTLVAALLLASLGVPLWALWTWEGAWRLAAAVPALLLLAAVGRIVIDTRRDPTSHNLWPLELFLYAAVALLLLALLAGLRNVAVENR